MCWGNLWTGRSQILVSMGLTEYCAIFPCKAKHSCICHDHTLANFLCSPSTNTSHFFFYPTYIIIPYLHYSFLYQLIFFFLKKCHSVISSWIHLVNLKPQYFLTFPLISSHRWILRKISWLAAVANFTNANMD